jgi:PHD/YefM family antitoxin component YafN of YafNO toxin-antitoxin module
METAYLKHQFVTDPKGKKVAVIIPIHEYEKMIEELDELEDIRIYDESKVADTGAGKSLLKTVR